MSLLKNSFFFNQDSGSVRARHAVPLQLLFADQETRWVKGEISLSRSIILGTFKRT
jgi:hypothetical protein